MRFELKPEETAGDGLRRLGTALIDDAVVSIGARPRMP
jgi:hypothetical protein